MELVDYFLLKPDPEAGPFLQIPPFEGGRPAVQTVSFDPELRLPDLYFTPCLLFSECLKRLLALYAPGLRWIPFVLADSASGAQQNYFQTALPVVDCVSAKSTFTLSGRVKNLVLKRKALEGRNILSPVLRTEAPLVVSLPLAESILRRGLYGICLERIAGLEEESG